MDSTHHTTRTDATARYTNAFRSGGQRVAVAGAGLAIAAAGLLTACDDASDADRPTTVTEATAPPAAPRAADADRAARMPGATAPDNQRPAGFVPESWRVERTAIDDGANESVILRVPSPGGGEGLLVERIHPTQVRVGEPIEYTIAVENISELAMHDIRIKEWRSQGIEVLDVSTPNRISSRNENAAANGRAYNGSASEGGGGQARGDERQSAGSSGPSEIWTIDRLMPGQSEIISVTALADREGDVGVCMTVSYEPVICLTTEVVQPDLLIRKVIEQNQAFVCDPVEVVYIIENIGTGTAEGVRVTDRLQGGLTDADGAREIAFTVPRIASGETAEQRVMLRAEEPGVYASFATATSGDLRARTRETPVQFIRPQLEMRVDAPAREYVGRDVPVRIVVRNNSEWPALETSLTIPVLADLSRVSVSTQDTPAEGGILMIGRMEPGETRTIDLRFAADEALDYDIEVIADAYCAVPVAQRVGIEVLGIEAVRLETIDLVDPVAVGEQTVHEVRVKNQGSAESINVIIRATLPDEMSFVSADGDSPVRADGSQLEFAPIERLAPGDMATWRITALAEAPGKTRFRLELTSDATRRPVIEQEPTTLIPAPVVPQRD